MELREPDCIIDLAVDMAARPIPTPAPKINKAIFNTNHSKQEEYMNVICDNCGASNRIKTGSSVCCEYCGSMLRKG